MPRPLLTLDTDGQKRLTRQIDHAFEEVAKLSGSAIPPTEFFETFLARTISGMDGFAGAICIRTPQGFLQIQCQSNMAKVGLDEQPNGRQVHNELLRQAFAYARPIMLDPFHTIAGPDGSQAANLTDFVVFLAPIASEDGTVVGLLEIWSEAYTDNRVHATFYKYIEQMSGYASNYNRNYSAKKNSQQEEVWVNIEAFTKKIHTSLNPTEVAFQVANEGKRLIDCDRICVGVRHSNKKCTVEAVSGADVVEKSSTHVRALRRLFDRVIDWNETLIYKGERDESLPPNVLDALDGYLAEANPKLLVVKPLREEREIPKEGEKEKSVRSAISMECFDPPERSDTLIERLDVIAPHCASALYNAAEMKAIPLKPLWVPVSVVQRGIGGKTKLYILLGTLATAALVAAMILIPYPLKIKADGQLQPKERRFIYPQMEGVVSTLKVKPGDIVSAKAPLAEMFSMELLKELTELDKKIEAAEKQIGILNNNLSDEKLTTEQRTQFQLKKTDQEAERNTNLAQRAAKLLTINADPRQLGYFKVSAPEFPRARNARGNPVWRVISEDNSDRMLNRPHKPTEPLLRIANTTGAWEIELKIPQKYIGKIQQAYQTDSPEEYLEVDVMLSSQTTTQYKGRLYKKDLNGEARENRDSRDESEPVILAKVTVNEAELSEDQRIPDDLMLSGLEVRTKIRCQKHAMGYSLFHGVWEFLYEHVVFWF